MDPEQNQCDLRAFLMANIRQLEKEKADWKAEQEQQRTARDPRNVQQSLSRDPVSYHGNLGEITSWENCCGVSNEVPTKENSKGPSCGCSVNPVVEIYANQSQQLQGCSSEHQNDGSELNQQKTSFLQKVMDNARSILSMKSVQCTESAIDEQKALTDNTKSQLSCVCCRCSMQPQNQPVQEDSPCSCCNHDENLLVDLCLCGVTALTCSSSSAVSDGPYKLVPCNALGVGGKSSNISNVGNCPASTTQTSQTLKGILVDRVNQSSWDVENSQQTDVGGVRPPCRSNAAIQPSRVSFGQITSSTPKCSTASMKSNEFSNLQTIGDGCNCIQQSNQQTDIDKLTKEIRLENHVLKTELLEMRMQLKHCLENIEGPIKQKLEAEQMKNEKIQSELAAACLEITNLKMQLCKACSDTSELNRTHKRLKEELAQLDNACTKLEDELVNQKLSEAETLKLLRKRNLEKRDSIVCDSTLSVITRQLSRTIKETNRPPECAPELEELTEAARRIKQLSDAVINRKNRLNEEQQNELKSCSCGDGQTELTEEKPVKTLLPAPDSFEKKTAKTSQVEMKIDRKDNLLPNDSDPCTAPCAERKECCPANELLKKLCAERERISGMPGVGDTKSSASRYVSAEGSKGRMSGDSSLSFEEVREGYFPFPVEPHGRRLDHEPSRVLVTTTITDSGVLEIITEAPGGVIETILNYTDDGRLEVITHVKDKSDGDILQSTETVSTSTQEQEEEDKIEEEISEEEQEVEVEEETVEEPTEDVEEIEEVIEEEPTEEEEAELEAVTAEESAELVTEEVEETKDAIEEEPTDEPLEEAVEIEEVVVEEPTREPVEEDVEEPVEEPLQDVKEIETVVVEEPEPVEAPIVEPMEEPIVEPMEEPKIEPMEEPIAPPVEEPKVEPVEEPKVEPVEEPKIEPVEEPKIEPVEEPKVEPVEEPKVEPVEEPKIEPVEEPKVEPVEAPISAPMEEPIAAPVEEPETVEPEEDPSAVEPVEVPSEEISEAVSETISAVPESPVMSEEDMQSIIEEVIIPKVAEVVEEEPRIWNEVVESVEEVVEDEEEAIEEPDEEITTEEAVEVEEEEKEPPEEPVKPCGVCAPCPSKVVEEPVEEVDEKTQDVEEVTEEIVDEVTPEEVTQEDSEEQKSCKHCGPCPCPTDVVAVVEEEKPVEVEEEEEKEPEVVVEEPKPCGHCGPCDCRKGVEEEEVQDQVEEEEEKEPSVQEESEEKEESEEEIQPSPCGHCGLCVCPKACIDKDDDDEEEKEGEPCVEEEEEEVEEEEDIESRDFASMDVDVEEEEAEAEEEQVSMDIEDEEDEEDEEDDAHVDEEEIEEDETDLDKGSEMEGAESLDGTFEYENLEDVEGPTTADCACQSRPQTDQACQCCECKDVACSTSDDKQTITDDETMVKSTSLSLVEEAIEDIEDSEFITIAEKTASISEIEEAANDISRYSSAKDIPQEAEKEEAQLPVTEEIPTPAPPEEAPPPPLPPPVETPPPPVETPPPPVETPPPEETREEVESKPHIAEEIVEEIASILATSELKTEEEAHVEVEAADVEEKGEETHVEDEIEVAEEEEKLEVEEEVEEEKYEEEEEAEATKSVSIQSDAVSKTDRGDSPIEDVESTGESDMEKTSETVEVPSIVSKLSIDTASKLIELIETPDRRKPCARLQALQQKKRKTCRAVVKRKPRESTVTTKCGCSPLILQQTQHPRGCQCITCRCARCTPCPPEFRCRANEAKRRATEAAALLYPPSQETEQEEDDKDGVAEDFDGVAEDFDGVAEDFDGVAEDFDGVAEDFDGVAEDLDGVAEDFDGVAESHDGFADETDGVAEDYDSVLDEDVDVADNRKRSSVRRHPSDCECVDCVCMPTIRELAETREMPIVFDEKQIFQVRCIVKCPGERRSRIPLPINTTRPPRVRSGTCQNRTRKPMTCCKILDHPPVDSDVGPIAKKTESESSSIYYPSCDCCECECHPCLSNKNPSIQEEKRGREISIPGCCCEGVCACEACPAAGMGEKFVLSSFETKIVEKTLENEKQSLELQDEEVRGMYIEADIEELDVEEKIHTQEEDVEDEEEEVHIGGDEEDDVEVEYHIEEIHQEGRDEEVGEENNVEEQEEDRNNIEEQEEDRNNIEEEQMVEETVQEDVEQVNEPLDCNTCAGYSNEDDVPDCDCFECECEEDETEESSESDRNEEKCDKTPDKIPSCDCCYCECGPCADSLQQLKNETCDCRTCECVPCADEKVQQNKRTGPVCDCKRSDTKTTVECLNTENCTCVICMAHMRKTPYVPGCTCVKCACGKDTHPDCTSDKCDCAICIAHLKKRPHLEGCSCAICVGQLKKQTEKHGVDCKCDLCVGGIDPKMEETTKHGPDCKCVVCASNEAAKKETTKHGVDCDCDRCLCIDTKKEVTMQHGEECKCDACDCIKCLKETPNVVDVASKQTSVAMSMRSLDGIPEDCVCPQCQPETCKYKPIVQETKSLNSVCVCPSSCKCDTCIDINKKRTTNEPKGTACVCSSSCKCESCIDKNKNDAATSATSCGITSRRSVVFIDEIKPVKTTLSQGVQYDKQQTESKQLQVSSSMNACVCSSPGSTANSSMRSIGNQGSIGPVPSPISKITQCDCDETTTDFQVQVIDDEVDRGCSCTPSSSSFPTRKASFKSTLTTPIAVECKSCETSKNTLNTPTLSKVQWTKHLNDNQLNKTDCHCGVDEKKSSRSVDALPPTDGSLHQYCNCVPCACLSCSNEKRPSESVSEPLCSCKSESADSRPQTAPGATLCSCDSTKGSSTPKKLTPKASSKMSVKGRQTVDARTSVGPRRPCDCPTCLCPSCPDPKIKKDIKNMDSKTLKKQIRNNEKESCECKQQIDELLQALEKINCACKEAELRSLQCCEGNRKPFVKKASDFGQTMSGLKLALQSLQEKCKAKDKMIEAMTGELKTRVSAQDFNEVMRKAGKIDKAIDYDAQPVKSACCCTTPSLTRTKSSLTPKDTNTQVLYPLNKEKFNTSTSTQICVNTSTGNQTQTEEKSNKDVCCCSKPHITQNNEKSCGKIVLKGFDVMDIKRITEDSIIVKWSSPGSKDVVGYDIFVNGTLSSKVMSGSRTSAMVHSLDLSRTIQVTVYAVTRCGRVEPPALAIYEISKC